MSAVCIPGPEGGHPTWNGRTAILKGLVRGEPTHEFTYAWDPGDGSPPHTGTVTDLYAVAASHVYTGTAAGQTLQATLTVTDTTAGQAATCAYPILIRSDDRPARIDAAIDDGLWFLHTRMQRRTGDGVDLGFWAEDYPIATTGTAVLAFEVQGHQAGGDPVSDPYVGTVQRGLNYLLDQLQSQPIGAQPAGDPDANGNGLGLYAASEDSTVMYEVGIVAMALAGSGTPDAVTRSRNPDVDGRAYREVTQDLVDFVAWAQADADCGSARGGWRYEANSCSADMSVSQWPVLGMQAAENNWQVSVPEWVKTELRDGFLTYAQGTDGGFGYKDPGSGNVARTAAGLVGLAFAGVPGTSQQVRQATDFIGQDWDSDNLDNFYAMYGVMKGSKLTVPEIARYGDHDWYVEYAGYLVAQQRQDGSWNDPGYAKDNLALSTGWAVLILSPTVFAAPLTLPRLPLWPFILVPLLFLGGLGFWLWRKRRHRPLPQAVTRPGARRPPVVPGRSTEKRRPKEPGADVTHGRNKKR